MKKKIPAFKTDREAEAFVALADLTKYDLAGAKPVRFEFEKKDARIKRAVI
jgi:predicted DNA binding CopG/RHH family protein